MGMTATALGREMGRTAREMNTLLKEHGFMEGDPGAYRPTDLGKAFAHEHDFDNGYGGFAHRSWGWLSWSEEILDALKASIQANPDGVAAAAPVPQGAAELLGPPASSRAPGAGARLLNKNGLAVAVAVAALVATAPVAKRVWTERVKPTASRVRDRLAKRPSGTPVSPAEPAPGE